MPRKIKSWEELVGLESEKYKLEIDVEGECGWILPKPEIEQTQSSSYRVYLTTHTFYPKHYKWATEILQKHGFDVELLPDA